MPRTANHLFSYYGYTYDFKNMIMIRDGDSPATWNIHYNSSISKIMVEYKHMFSSAEQEATDAYHDYLFEKEILDDNTIS